GWWRGVEAAIAVVAHHGEVVSQAAVGVARDDDLAVGRDDHALGVILAGAEVRDHLAPLCRLHARSAAGRFEVYSRRYPDGECRPFAGLPVSARRVYPAGTPFLFSFAHGAFGAISPSRWCG